MRKINRISLLFGFCIIICFSCTNESKYIEIQSNYNFAVKDEPFHLGRSQFLMHQNLLPALLDEDGTWIPSQVDDLNRDGNWDELAFVCDLDSLSTKKIKIVWVDKNHYPIFKSRTNIHFGIYNGQKKTIESVSDAYHTKYNLPRGGNPNYIYPYQMDGPTWENDKMGYRQYFDGRNCRDLFGKTVTTMVLDTVGVLPDGTPGNTYQELSNWGRDVLSCASSFGLAGIAIQTPDSLLRLGVDNKFITDIVDTTQFQIITKGPIRSMFSLNYKGWNIGNDKKIDLKETVTIWAGSDGYLNQIITSPLPKDCFLVTGIVTNCNSNPLRKKSYENQILSFSTHDKQTFDKNLFLGMSIVLPSSNYINDFDENYKDHDITDTWCIKMKPDLNNSYNFYAFSACELGDKRFKSSQYYYNKIDSYCMRMINKPSMIIK